jgi:hypothetical protein
MITNKGKSVISKYLIGQTPSYASYIAIGCGASPVLPGYDFAGNALLDPPVLPNVDSIAPKESLDFETFRAPITSKGYVTENGVSRLVLTAQIPAENRYGITEVGIYPAANNPVAINNDSRNLISFSSNESWSKKQIGSATTSVLEEGTITTVDGNIDEADSMFVTAFDAVFTSELRALNNEVPRNGASSILVPGNLTTFTSSSPSSGNFLLLQNSSTNLITSSPVDKLKIAFSVLSNGLSEAVSGTATIMVEFGSSDQTATGGYARALFNVDISDTSSGKKRYFVSEISVKDVQTFGGFSWTDAPYVKVFVNAGEDNMVALDGLRIDNVSSISPVYGLVGYTVVANALTTTGGTTGAVPVVKDKDKTSLIEFRFQASVI